MTRFLKRRRTDSRRSNGDRGVTLVEYALVVATSLQRSGCNSCSRIDSEFTGVVIGTHQLELLPQFPVFFKVIPAESATALAACSPFVINNDCTASF